MADLPTARESLEPSADLGTAVARAADRLRLGETPLASETIARLEDYCRLMWEWNERLNLTRHTDFDKFVARDLVDSMELSRLIEPGERVLDIGSGGGVPGIVLAILRPDITVTLSESVAKKARALEDMVQKLGLPVSVVKILLGDLLEAGRITARHPRFAPSKARLPDLDTLKQVLHGLQRL